MSNTFLAHIFKRAQKGPREEVVLKLFNRDGSPLELGESPGGGTPDPGTPVELPEGLMIFRGVFDPTKNYSPNDVVLHASGNETRTAIFTAPHSAGQFPTLSFMGSPVNKFYGGSPVQIEIGPNSPKSSTIRTVDGPYDAVAFNVTEAGNLVVTSRPKPPYGGHDAWGVMYKLNGSTWTNVGQDDDSAGSQYPKITVANAQPGTYLFAFTPLRDYVPGSSQEGISEVLLDGANTAGVSSFLGFPADKTLVLSSVPSSGGGSGVGDV